ncbi:MAG TPA: DUF1345 domain-containing protein [Mesorhizobium sp.]|jgi:uncharacterized membrane protein|uniref:DUF1345 domain-containing protein n=1 Tax=Mesorhizobium sp. TaxID=1871066 RepID=UPI002DDCC6CF|nr:DUF1345 domain-containing protein [Mesorhizobium sp.]HEV2504228.1 DUF1345 domain-containing protein [Mesorhizobium sp.]
MERLIGKSTNRLMPFAAAACVGLITLAIALQLRLAIAYSIGADAFFFVYIGLMLARMPYLTAEHLRRKASADDLPIFIIFAVTAAVIAVVVGSLFLIVNDNHKHSSTELLMSLVSLPLGWLTIHTMAAFHYAHVYWRDDEVPDAKGKPVRRPVGGLAFPGEKPPQGWDFFYFAIVIGMTAQTADTNVTTTRMRKLVILHSLISFLFNTVIVAAAVNVAVTLGN